MRWERDNYNCHVNVSPRLSSHIKGQGKSKANQIKRAECLVGVRFQISLLLDYIFTFVVWFWECCPEDFISGKRILLLILFYFFLFELAFISIPVVSEISRGSISKTWATKCEYLILQGWRNLSLDSRWNIFKHLHTRQIGHDTCFQLTFDLLQMQRQRYSTEPEKIWRCKIFWTNNCGGCCKNVENIWN